MNKIDVIITKIKLSNKSIENNVIFATNTKDGTDITIEADTIINALGSKKNLFDDNSA